MKILFILSLLISALLSKDIKDPYKNINYLVLDNGMKVYILSNKKAVNTKLTIEVQMGTDIENEKNAGITHLIEHLVFRDKDIPFNDYIDYLKDEGAFNINGYTHRDKTEYLATIKSEKTLWLLKTFSNMLFKMDLTEEDLRVEKQALQTEIGELKWYNSMGYYISKVNKLFPKDTNHFEEEFIFKKEKEKEKIKKYFYKRNNNKFILEDIKTYYEDYYYPSNMVLKIAGNFNNLEVENYIKEVFGKIKNSGDKTTKKPNYNTQVNNKTSIMYVISPEEASSGLIGAKYIENSYKKYLIISSYLEFTADKLQQKLRNELGLIYSVHDFRNGIKDAVISGINFKSINDNFDENLKIIKEQIKFDAKDMKDNDITEALDDYGIYYSSIETDINSIFDLIETQSYVHERYKEFEKTPYEIFKSINLLDFQNTITKTFKEKNEYNYITKDYYFFPYDIFIFVFISILLSIILYININKYRNKKLNLFYSSRDIIFTRRISNRFFSIINFILILFVATVISEWIEYLFRLVILRDEYYFYRIHELFMFFTTFISFLFFILIYFVVAKTIFKFYFAKIDITSTRINLQGNIIQPIEKDEIINIEKVSWSLNKYFKTYGVSFYKDLVLVETNKNKKYYLRSSNGQELEDDLKKWWINK